MSPFSIYNLTDELVDLRTLFLANLDLLLSSHQMNSLLLGMSPLIEQTNSQGQLEPR
jgi:hypothetical protein